MTGRKLFREVSAEAGLLLIGRVQAALADCNESLRQRPDRKLEGLAFVVDSRMAMSSPAGHTVYAALVVGG